MRSWRSEAIAIAGLIILAGIGYGPLWKRGHMPYSRHSDIIAKHLATKNVAFESLQQGRGLPFWKPDQILGISGLTHPEALYTNPFHLLFWFVDPPAAVGPTLWIHFLMMAISMYVWGAVLGYGIAARLIMAVAGLFCFKLIIIAYAGWLPIMPFITFYPLLVVSIHWVIKRPGLSSSLTLAGCGTVAMHSGNLQLFYYLVLLGGAYVFIQVVQGICRGHWAHMGWTLAWLIVAVVLTAGISAYLVLPLAAEAPLISRTQADFEFFLDEHHHLKPRYLLTFLHPHWLGTPLDGSYPTDELWEDAAYFGLVPLLLAVLGAVWGFKLAATRWLIAGVAISILLTVDTPVLRFLFDHVPGYDLFRMPNRFLFFTAIGGISLAGIAIDQFLRWWIHRKRRIWFAHGVVVILLLVMSAEGMYYARRYLPMLPQKKVMPWDGFSNLFSDDQELFRVAPAGRWTFNYGWASMVDWQIITGYDSYNLNHYRDYFDLLTGYVPSTKRPRAWMDMTHLERPDLLDALNVKYVISRTDISLPPNHFELIDQRSVPVFEFYGPLDEALREDKLFVYRNQHFLQRAYWASRVLTVSDEPTARKLVSQVDVSQTAVVVHGKSVDRSRVPSDLDEVDLVDSHAGYLKLRTHSTSNRYLVISEGWHPGWRATLDALPVDIHQTNLALLGLWVPAGTHDLELQFRPMYWNLARGISIICATVYLFLIFSVVLRTALLFRKTHG